MLNEEVKKDLIQTVRNIQDKCIKNNLLKEKLKEKILSKVIEINNSLDLVIINDNDKNFKTCEVWNSYLSLDKVFKDNYVDFTYYIQLKSLDNVSLISLNEIIETFEEVIKEITIKLESQLDNVKE